MKPTNYRAPAASRIMAAFNCDQETAETARRLIQGKERTRENPRFPKVQKWLDQCHHEPRRLDRILACLNELLECHGIEALWSEKDMFWPAADYLNTGDTYSATILFNRETQAFQLTAWGDFYERNQRRYALK